MAVANDYVTGTITLTNGASTFTGTGTAWRLAGFRDGDLIYVDNLVAVIAPNSLTDPLIDSNTAGKLTRPWTGTTGTRPYRMSYKPDGARVTAETRNLIELLGNGNLQTIAALTPTINAIIRGNAGGTAWEKFTATAFAFSLLDDANAAAFYATLGVVPDGQLPARISASASNEFSTDANNILETGFYTIGSAASNNPTGTTGLIINIRQVVGYARQLFFERDGTRNYSRNLVNSVWTAWVETTSDPAGTGRSTAALGVNDVGAYIFGNNQQAAQINTGATVNGLNLRFARITPTGTIATNAGTQSGSWMSCNATKLDTESNVSGVYKRIL